MARQKMQPAMRRAALLNAARRLIAEQGFAQTSVSDIVRAAGVAQGTFYWHFKSKEEALGAVAEEIVTQTTEAIAAAARQAGLDAVAKLERIREIFFAYVDRERDFLEQFHDPHNRRLHDLVNQEATRRIVPMVAEVIEQGVAEGVLDVAFPLEAAAFVVAATQMVTERRVYGLAAPLAQIERAFMDFVYKGLGSAHASGRAGGSSTR